MSQRRRSRHQSTQTDETTPESSPKNSTEEVNGSVAEGEFYEDPASLYERLLEVEEVNLSGYYCKPFYDVILRQDHVT